MAERESRLAPLVHANQKDRHKPNAQGDFGAMKNRSGGDRSLMMTFYVNYTRFPPLRGPNLTYLGMYVQIDRKDEF